MTDTNERPTFQFLPDSPVTEDEFGSHARVADSIAEKVTSDTPGMSIGLEGTWGSGKSSVIRMLEKRWENSKNIKVFTFDAWAHEGDSLRRGFLEEMITFLQSLDGDSAAWLSTMITSCDRPRSDCSDCADISTCRPDIIREELRHRRESSTIESEPKITQWGIWFALATLVMPIGVALLSASRNLTDWHFYFGTFLAAAPLVWIAAFIIHRWVTKKKGGGYLAEIVGKTKDITTHTTHRGVEPTSIEFAEYYSEILDACLADDLDRKLVIVLDNLDRIGEDAARKAWATMRTFLRPGNAKDGDFRAKIWLIVPYDPGAIERLWPQSGEDEQDDQNKNRDNQDQQDQNATDAGLARAFREKTFQIRYRVAPPLASRWEVFFKGHLAVALVGASDDDLRAVYHIFRIQALPAYHRGAPTPREMKIFINRVVALARQHVSDVDLPEIALYAALELNGKFLLDNLAEGELKNEQFFSDFLAPDWRECLAAIHFGVPRKDAAEVLYEPKLREILQNGDAQAMQELLIEEPAQQCCERHLRDKAVEMSFSEVLAASRAFAQFTTQSASSSLGRAIGWLAHRLASIDGDAWVIGGELNKTTAVDIIRLLQFRPKIGNVLTDCLCVRLPDESKVDNLDIGLSEWASGASIIVAELAKGDNFHGITIEMPEPAKYQVLLDLLATDAVGRKVIKFFQPVPQAKVDYRNHVVSQVDGGAFREEDKHILAGMMQMSCWEHNEVASLVSRAVLKCLSRDGVNKDVFCRAVKFLFEQASAKDANPAFKNTLKKYGASPYVCTALQQHHGQPKAAALCVTLLLLHNPQPNFPDGQPAGQGKQQYDKILASSGQNVAQAMATICIEYEIGDEILNVIQANTLDDKPFTSTLLAKLAESDNALKTFTTATFLKYHDLLLSTLDKDGDGGNVNPYERLAGRLLRAPEGSLLTAIESNSIALNMMRPCYLAINSDDVDTNRLEERLREYFSQDVQQDQWLKELVEGSRTLDVMLLLQRKPKGLSLDHRYANALVEHAIRMRDGSAKINEKCLLDEWASLLDCIAASEKEPFRRRLNSDVIEDGGKPLTLLLPTYGEEILEAVAWLYQESNKRKKRDIESKLIRLAEHDAQDHRSWLLHLLAGRMDVSDMSEKTIKCLCSRLKDPLKAIISQNASSGADDGDEAETQSTFVVTSDKAKELAQALGVVLEDVDDTSKDDESSEQVEG